MKMSQKPQPTSTSFRGFKDDERCRFRPLKGDGIRVVVRMTHRCDLHCPHCLVSPHYNLQELGVHDWFRIFSQLPDIRAKKVLLTGGEPLLYKDITRIVEFISQMDIPVDLNSNLQRMTPQLICDMRNAGLTEISVSLEGPREVHDAMHGTAGAYDKLLDAIKWAADLGIQVDVACCVTNENINYIRQIIEMANSLSVQSLTVSRMFPIGHGAKYHRAPTQNQLDEIYRELTEYVIPDSKLPIRLVGLLNPPDDRDCLRAKSLIGITPTGQLVGCVLAPENTKRIPHPLDSGLKESFLQLEHELFSGTFPMCWNRKKGR